MEYISADKIFINNKLESDMVIGIKGEIIKELEPIDSIKEDITNYKNCIIIPGFIDTHLHGFKGIELIDASVEDIVEMSNNILKTGVTSFVPTLQTDRIKRIDNAIKNIVKASKETSGAEILGIFLEGPFISKKYKGAQDDSYLQLPNVQQLKKWIEDSESMIIKLAVAPELPGAMQLIEYARDNNIIVALGHSNADKKTTKDAISKGASVLIHTFNGMRPLHHREPGILGVSLLDDTVYAEITPDGFHLDVLIIELILRLKGYNKTVVITDSTLAAGLPDGEYSRSGVNVFVKEGAVRTKEGQLAGSSLTMDKAFKNLISWGITTLENINSFINCKPSVIFKSERLWSN